MVPARVALALISALGATMIYMIRINLSVAIVDMVVTVSATDASSRTNVVPHCFEGQESDINKTENAHLNTKNLLDLKNMTSNKLNFSDEQYADKLFLTSGQRGSVLAAFFYGYFLTGIIGGRLAETYGTKVVVGTSAFLGSLLTLLTPVAARTHYIALIVLRVAMGLAQNGLLSSLPFLTRYLGGNSLSWLGDLLVAREWLQKRNSRRLFTSIGLCIPAVMLAIVGYVGCNSAAAMTILCIGTFSNGATVSGYVANQHDIAPNFAGTMLGISNMFAFAGAMLAPIIVGVMTPDQTPGQWQSAFWVATVIYILAATFFFFACSSELQPWNFAGSGGADGAKEREEGMTFLKERQKVQVVAKKDRSTHC
ncbi:sialin-like [Penaeus indicus]|uniref:sialin-like n=1 Tax=Penaeus indicus TaxID=29960 RepID=UPI00300CFB5F